MHILFATPAYAPVRGGGERYAAALAANLSAKGHRVTVITSSATSESDLWLGREPSTAAIRPSSFPTVIRCPVRPMPGGRKGLMVWRKAMILISAMPGSQAGILHRMASRVPAIVGMNEALSKLEPTVDIVHGFNISWEQAMAAGWRYAGSRGIPFVVTPFAHLGSSDERDKVALNSTMDHQRQLMADASALIALTAIEAEGLRQRRAVPAEVAVIGAGLDPLPPASDGQEVIARYGIVRPFALFIGRASYDKGAIHAAKTVLALNQQGVAVNLVLVGQITEEFSRFYERLTAEERGVVQPVGFMDETTKHALLEQSSFLMLPSRTDSFGIVLLEAWAHGKPVIAARSGGIPGVVDEGKNGFLVQFGDVPAMTEAARLLLLDNSLSHRMGEEGRKKVNTQYNWAHLTDQMLDVYQSILSQ